MAAIRTTIERTAKTVRALRFQAKTTSADLLALGEAVEQALAATNDRLTSLERHVLGEAGPSAVAAEEAMRRLRSVVRAPEGSPEP